jgi:adenosylhomocysteine nucleosidase
MIAIIGAMEEEVEILKGEITDAKKESVACFKFICGKLSGKDVVLLQCGIGKVQAAVGCAILINKYSPSVVINSGCAGGINPAGCIPINFGDAVISSGLVYHDFDIRDFGYALGQVPGQDDAIFLVDKNIINAAENSVAELLAEGALPKGFNAVAGLICSGDVFMSDSKRVIELAKIFPGLRAVEMEGAAIAHTCTLFNIPFIVLRCLSDIAGEESPMKFDEFLPIAAKNSSSIVKRLVFKL